MSKKQLVFLLISNIFVVLLGNIVVWGATTNKFDTLTTTLPSRIHNESVQTNNLELFSLQNFLVNMLQEQQKSVVQITISKDIKVYADDPAQLNEPASIQQQTSKVGGGNGIVVSKNGYIITNKHVVQDTNAKYSVTLYDGVSYEVDKIWFDEFLDLAIIKIVDDNKHPIKNLSPATFLELHSTVYIGQLAFVLSNTQTTMGIIGGKNKQLTINKSNLYAGLYQTDARANPGNSGSPLLDIAGHVVGMTTAITEGEGITFALPLSKEFVESTIQSIETFGNISRPVIGIQYIDITPAIKKEKNITLDTGIYVKDVITDLPGSVAGLKIGDIILRINGKDITNQLPFLYQLYTYLPGNTITLDILRDNKQLTLPILLGGGS